MRWSKSKLTPRRGSRGGRPHTDLAQQLRRRIAGGNYPPGRRLPARLKLVRELGASSATLQRAVNQLIEEGFLVTRGRGGTYVTDAPPHRRCLALATPPLPHGQHPSRFWDTLRRLALEADPGEGLSVTPYDDMVVGDDAGAYGRLVRDATAHRIAGVLTISMSWPAMSGSILAASRRLGRAALMGTAMAGVPRVALAPEMPLVCDELVRRKCRRVAVLYTVSTRDEVELDPTGRMWRHHLGERGLDAAPAWLVPIHPAAPQTARQVVRLLLASRPRPDSLVIADDHLVEQATMGVYDANLRVPDQLLVLVKSNFPDRPPSCVPVQRYGPNLSRIVDHGLRLMRRQLQGLSVPASVTVQHVLEQEQIASSSETTPSHA
jgi:hypothetical protein